MICTEELSNQVAQLSLNHFEQLQKTGKPTTKEWTILATIVQENTTEESLEVVALGTGSKCIGKNTMSKKGDVLNDSHAEIVCRRAFLRYLYSELEKALKNNSSVFEKLGTKFSLKEDICFHFFSTHVPCGDAAIFPKQNTEEFGKCVTRECGKRCVDEVEVVSSACKRFKMDEEEFECNDVYRTGGKCLPNSEMQDPRSGGLEYHVLGAVRTKPGRGDPTLSVSCSDKLAKWNYLGIQGALLSLLIDKPIYLHSFVIAGNTPCNFEALTRALYGRFGPVNLEQPYKQNGIIFGRSNLAFERVKSDEKRPCPNSIIWAKTSQKPLEVSVEGRKLGATKKTLNTKKSRLLVCKVELFRTFVSLATQCAPNIFADTSDYDLSKLTYQNAKLKATDYQKAWMYVKSNCFKVWTDKDVSLLEFCLD